ncbi:Phosphate ABC transporter, substrate-binding protein PstS (TC 3.A.1.7.1) [uncultured Gammaproteobacteria bacterium]|nr:Phosphate ABC transporter, substrate-binding protein PstS (TC 3.A.1.7.1) [uncultured Gammaproteobacteria bacterium]
MKNIYKSTAVIIASSAIMSISNSVVARDHIDVVGSSTVYPFATVVAETFGKKTGGKTPKIESTGSGGGMKLFCAGNGISTPDITNASRRIKLSEYNKCQKNGVKDIIEVMIGFDGIAIANSKQGPAFNLTRRELFLALAKQVPNDQAGELIDNPYTKWSDINPALPNTKIEVLGPPPTSGTRDAFAELALQGGCFTYDWIKQIKKDSKTAKKSGDKSLASQLKKKYKTICHSIREDGSYVEVGENDNLIVEKLRANPKALGVFGFSFLDQNSDVVKGAVIDGVKIDFEAIADGSYPISRPLYFYVKKSHVGKVPGIKEFIAEFTSEDAWGEDGYLTDKGLIPLSDDARQKMSDSANGLAPLKMQ